MLERYGHGGDVWSASELYGLDKNEFLDFSSNMNPLGPPEPVGRILTQDWRKELVRYPDPACRELRAKIARTYGIPEDCILPGNGAAELIDLAVRVLMPSRMGLFRPSFSEYEDAARRCGAEVRDLFLREEDGFDPQAETVVRELAGCDTLFAGHPNNPTGRLLDPGLIRFLLQQGVSPDRPLRIILDEAFIDFSEREDEWTFIREAAGSDRLFVVRSMTKFYAIPGLRLGFIVARPDWILRMKNLQVHWSVNALAQRIGTEVLGDTSFARAAHTWLKEEKRWLTDQMSGLSLSVTPGSANYLLFRLPHGVSFGIRELQAAMGRRGVLIRDASLFKGLDLSYGRTAIRLREDNARLVSALRQSLEELYTDNEIPEGESRMDRAKTLMVQGTASDVGKSVLTAALCRIFVQDGLRTAPFKSQNMSLNSYVTPDGKEIGRAQGMQADACRVAATTDMNPILLKPKKDMTAQVVVHGKPYRDYDARAYREEYLAEAESIVREALERLRSQADIVVIEGAGSPAEVNLKDRDIVNMRLAGWADAPVILAADIDRGGVFASIVGTMEILEPHERERVKGFVINKFRGDVTLLKPGLDWLEQRTGKPVLGVIPFLPNLGLEDEDSASLDARLSRAGSESRPQRPDTLDIAVLRLPRLSNFTDFDPLPEEPDVRLRFVADPKDFGKPDAVILPGSKNTVDDLLFLRESGLETQLQRHAAQGGAVAGICAGYQMMGERLSDPDLLESDRDELHGLGFFPAETLFTPEKRTVRIAGTAESWGQRGKLGQQESLPVTGYEIHMGRTRFTGPVRQPFRISEAVLGGGGLTAEPGSRTGVLHPDGAVDGGGTVWGTYIHGILHNDGFRRMWLNLLRERKGWEPLEETVFFARRREEAFERLAGHVRRHLDMERIYEMIGAR